MKAHLSGAMLIALSGSVIADTVQIENLIVQQSACIGVECLENEDFSFETLKVKSESPQILFDDTSSSASFPANDWQLGASDEVAGDAASFYIEDKTGQRRVLEISPEGDVALGSLSTVVEGAVSVGSETVSRRVAFVADATADTDAVNLRTAQSLVGTTEITTKKTELDNAINALNARLSSLADRIAALESAEGQVE